MNAVTKLVPGQMLVFETEHYTDWRCSKCKVWRERTYPATVFQRSTGSTIQCREHSADDEDVCECGCHETGACNDCECEW